MEIEYGHGWRIFATGLGFLRGIFATVPQEGLFPSIIQYGHEDFSPNIEPNMIMKRRQFIKSASIIGASTLILPRTKLFGADAPSNKLNIALIGTWGRGEAHFGAISG